MTLYTLLKIFESKRYAEQFLNGSLYLNTLRYFAEEYEDHGELRGDAYEGLIGHYQPSEIGKLTIGGIEIPISELAGPMLVHSHALLDNNVLCMYAVHSGSYQTIDETNLADFRESLKIPAECHALGAHCVVLLNPTEFMARCTKALASQKLPYTYGLVSYFDDRAPDAKFPDAEFGFHKRKRFAAQQEFRIRVAPTDRPVEPLKLEIGDLSDIALLLTPEEFNAGIHFQSSTSLQHPSRQPDQE